MLIYSHLTFQSQNTDHGLLRLEQRLQQMDQKPHRWKYAHSLFLNMQSDYEWSYCISLIKEATRKGSVFHQLAFKNTQIPGTSYDQTLLKTIAGLPLKSLDLSGISYGIGLRTIWKYFNLPALQHIRLCQFTWSDDLINLLKRTGFFQCWGYLTEEHATEYQQIELNHPDKCEQLPPVGRHHNLESLALPVRAVESDVANLLFLWPAHLKRVTLLYIHDTLDSQNYSAPVYQKLLSLHSASLEMIELPPIPGKGLLDLNAFHKLSVLHLHASSFFNTTPFDTSSKLRAPCLQWLTIDFTQQKQPNPEDLSNHRAKFLQQFIVTQKSAGQPRTSLRQIFLQFGPKTIAENSILLELLSSDLLMEVSAMAPSFDISLTYNKPVYVEDTFLSPRTVLCLTQRMIYDILLNPPTENGVHIDVFQNILGCSFAEVESTIHRMLEDGILFATVDAETYALI